MSFECSQCTDHLEFPSKAALNHHHASVHQTSTACRFPNLATSVLVMRSASHGWRCPGRCTRPKATPYSDPRSLRRHAAKCFYADDIGNAAAPVYIFQFLSPLVSDQRTHTASHQTISGSARFTDHNGQSDNRVGSSQLVLYCA